MSSEKYKPSRYSTSELDIAKEDIPHSVLPLVLINDKGIPLNDIIYGNNLSSAADSSPELSSFHLPAPQISLPETSAKELSSTVCIKSILRKFRC